MRIGFVGSRDFQNEQLVRDMVKGLPVFTAGGPFTVVSGGAQKRSIPYRKKHPEQPEEGGVDYWAEQEAVAQGWEPDIIYAEWTVHGKRAGMIRNAELVDSCTLILIFWDGQSNGSKNVIDLCRRGKKAYKVYGEVSAPEYPKFKRG